jgi:hypothetical protein
MLPALISSGRAVDLILGIMVLEFAVLSWRRKAAGRPAAPLDLLFMLAPGALILLALRASVTGAGWPWIAACLAASLPMHLADISRRRL